MPTPEETQRQNNEKAMREYLEYLKAANVSAAVLNNLVLKPLDTREGFSVSLKQGDREIPLESYSKENGRTIVSHDFETKQHLGKAGLTSDVRQDMRLAGAASTDPNGIQVKDSKGNNVDLPKELLMAIFKKCDNLGIGKMAMAQEISKKHDIPTGDCVEKLNCGEQLIKDMENPDVDHSAKYSPTTVEQATKMEHLCFNKQKDTGQFQETVRKESVKSSSEKPVEIDRSRAPSPMRSSEE